MLALSVQNTERSIEHYKKIDRPNGQQKTNMKHIGEYSQNAYTQDEIQLAHEIADRLQDPGALTQFLNFTKEFPHDVLRHSLDVACSVPDSEVYRSRAAIFVNRMKNYRRSGGSRY